MARATSADLPMPPRPSTLTTRQWSCTTHSESVASSPWRPKKLGTSGASPQSRSGPLKASALSALGPAGDGRCPGGETSARPV